jgi:hypothetical protein
MFIVQVVGMNLLMSIVNTLDKQQTANGISAPAVIKNQY